MRFRRTSAVAALSLIFGIVGTTDTFSAKPTPLEGGKGFIAKPGYTPLGLDNNMVTVVVQLSGDPVAVRQADQGRKLTPAEKDQIKLELRQRQDPLLRKIEALGGTVVGSYTSSYNGVKVRIARNKVEQLRSLPSVIDVNAPALVHPDHTQSLPYIEAPLTWQNTGFHGENVKVAVIDTGIDYTHANFGGPGTAAAYDAAHASETQMANPRLFGPMAPRVKGGIDLVGDSYDANPGNPTYQPIPHPDPNPLDCGDHGSHVAGSIGGSGVTAAGTTYTGAYDNTTIPNNNWVIGPGVAPKVDLYAVRVFGCNGSTDATVDAIEWAVDNDMDVINMSLGSSFGGRNDPSAVAAANAAKAGVIVVASAGNSGPGTYITGSPGSADGTISVAADDSRAFFPGANIAITGGATIAGTNANGYVLTSTPLNYTVKVIVDDPATTDRDESLGCSVADFGAVAANTIVVIKRGICARVAKAIFGQQAGAAAVLMINNSTAAAPYEGPIYFNPDDGVPYEVTIPFVGVKSNEGAGFVTGGTVGITTGPNIPNSTFKTFATFSSGGPRSGDSFLKPDITAPGVNIFSTQNGSGNHSLVLSGTSMAAPHVAGVAALTVQAHRTWKPEDIRAAIVNTGAPAQITSYKTSRGGTGLVQPLKSTTTQVVARAVEDKFSSTLNFGFAEVKANFSKVKQVILQNNGTTPAKFNVAQASAQGRAHTVTLSQVVGSRNQPATQITIPAKGSVVVGVTLNVPVATVGNIAAFREVAGLIQFTPVSASDNNNVTLRVPYYFVPRALSNVVATVPPMPAGTNPSVTAKVTNVGGPIAGTADFYAWGLEGPAGSTSPAAIRSVGIQTFPADNALGILINTHNRWSNGASAEFDVAMDVDGDGEADYIIVGVDAGAVTTGTFNGTVQPFVFSTRSSGASTFYAGFAPTDGTTQILYVDFSQLCRVGEPCVDAAVPVEYTAVGFDLVRGGSFPANGSSKFNLFDPPITTGDFLTMNVGATGTSTVQINSAAWATQPQKGIIVVSHDNAANAEAQLFKVGPRVR